MSAHRAIVIIKEEFQGTANQVALAIGAGGITFGPIYYDKDDDSLRSYGCNWQWEDGYNTEDPPVLWTGQQWRDAFVAGLIAEGMVQGTDFDLGDYANTDPASEPGKLDEILDDLNLRRATESDPSPARARLTQAGDRGRPGWATRGDKQPIVIARGVNADRQNTEQHSEPRP